MRNQLPWPVRGGGLCRIGHCSWVVQPVEKAPAVRPIGVSGLVTDNSAVILPLYLVISLGTSSFTLGQLTAVDATGSLLLPQIGQRLRAFVSVKSAGASWTIYLGEWPSERLLDWRRCQRQVCIQACATALASLV
jgi:hypothetical protein